MWKKNQQINRRRKKEKEKKLSKIIKILKILQNLKKPLFPKNSKILNNIFFSAYKNPLCFSILELHNSTRALQSD